LQIGQSEKRVRDFDLARQPPEAARASGKPSRWHDTQGIMPKAALHPREAV
jgi:hypothetical protein